VILQRSRGAITDWSRRINLSFTEDNGQPSLGNGSSAGPEKTSPVGLKRDPWHGQSQVWSALFQVTVHPKCVQDAESA